VSMALAMSIYAFGITYFWPFVCVLFLDLVFYGVRTAPYWKYVWNEYLLKNCYTKLQPDWLLYIVHGFIGQSSIFLA